MNEYKGFKVGDKVEVIQQGLRIHYKIGEIGVVAELLTNGLLAVVFGERREVVRPDNIKKLPKYSVGDVVRFKHKTGKNPTVVDKYGFIATIKSCDSHENICTLYEYPENYTECCFEPFDGFRVGDTVYTTKRGKGRIVKENPIYNKDAANADRKFVVKFDNENAGLYDVSRRPKLINLIPTEAKYKEALNKTGYTFKIDVAYVQEYVAKPKNEAAERQADKLAKIKAAGEAFYQAAKNMAAAFGQTTDQIKIPSGGVVFSGGTGIDGKYCEPNPYFGQVQVAPSAKFKVGDAVYHKGNKLFVKRNMISCPQMVEVGNSCAGYTTVVAESDLRLWKETVLTHCLQSDGKTWSDGGSHGWKKEWYKNIEVLYSGGEYDVFLVGSMRGNRCIFRGKKGDDIS